MNTANQTIQLIKKLDKIEKQLFKIKKEKFFPFKINISLRGILKGVNITDQDIQKAKKSIFKKINI